MRTLKARTVGVAGKLPSSFCRKAGVLVVVSFVVKGLVTASFMIVMLMQMTAHWF